MSPNHESFTRCWRDDAPRVMAYARRHVGDQEAHDVVSETFLAAWRRWDDVPDPAVAWLLVTARQVMSNQHRSARRRKDLADRIVLLDSVATTEGDTLESVLRRREALEQLASLSEEHREALLLVTWDGLTTEEAAAVLGLRPTAFRRRVSRARAVLDRLAEERPGHPGLHADSRLPLLITSKEIR